jgi:hypothetical protein
MQQELKFVFLMRLRGIIGGPILRVRRLVDSFGDLHRLSDGRTAIPVVLALRGKFDGEEVLSLQGAHFVVGTGAMWRFWIRADGIAAMP